MIVSRERRSGPDRFLYWKMAIFFLGAGFFMAGVATGRDWAVAVAIGVLFVGVVLRFLSRRGGEEKSSDGGEVEGSE